MFQPVPDSDCSSDLSINPSRLPVPLVPSLFFSPLRVLRVLGVQFLLRIQNVSQPMHPRYIRADELSRIVIGAAIEVHRTLGPGLLESIYEQCLLHELGLQGLPALSQRLVHVHYKDIVFEEVLKFDVLVDGCLLVEVKAVQDVATIHKAQALSYMKLLDAPLGLLLNFHEMKLTDGLHRLILPGAGWE